MTYSISKFYKRSTWISIFSWLLPTKASRIILGAIAGLFAIVPVTQAAGSESGHAAYGLTFLWIALLISLAKVSSLVERFGLPAVLGELIIGVALGNLTLIGVNMFEPIKSDELIKFLAELGVVILLFQVGLESNIQKMRQVGLAAFIVAIIGVVVPFVLGTWVIGPMLMPGMEFSGYLFLGATLTATSVGLTARVFKDLKKIHIPEAQIVLGAAVIDDVIGLIILAVVSAMAVAGAVSLGLIAQITAKALLFLVGAIILGQLLAPQLGRVLSKIHSGVGMKLTLALAFCLALSGAAQFIGLAPIVGAFAAGLILDPVHFHRFRRPELVEEVEELVNKNLPAGMEPIKHVIERHSEKHVEDLVAPIAYFLMPIFFVVTGMSVNLQTFANPQVVIIALAITAVAFVGKIVAGLGAGKVNKWLVGWGMVPRGEVGLIFAATGKALGVVSDSLFSVIVIMVILSTLLTPPILTVLLKRQTQ